MEYLRRTSILYWDLILGFLLFFIVLLNQHNFPHGIVVILSIISVVCFSIVVSKIADILSFKLNEPYSSFVLTFSAIAIEVILLSIFLHEGASSNNGHSLDIVKSGLLTAVIVDINFLLGLSVLIGGLSFKEQSHNEDTSSTYTTILLTAAVVLFVPTIVYYTNSDIDMLYKASISIGVLLFLFYISIFIFQTRTHTHFFANTAKSRIFLLKKRKEDMQDKEYIKHDEDYFFETMSIKINIFFIVGILGVVAILSEIFSHHSLIVFEEHNISIGLAALTIAIISVAPEVFTSIKAARHDEIQRAVNIGMGASTVSLLVAVPLVLAISYAMGVRFTLDFNTFHLSALFLSILLAWKTTENGETNYFEGISHLLIFFAFVVMVAF